MKINRANKILIRDAKQRRVMACGQKLAGANARMAKLFAEADALIKEFEADQPPLSLW